jgi:hypothetical protein
VLCEWINLSHWPTLDADMINAVAAACAAIAAFLAIGVSLRQGRSLERQSRAYVGIGHMFYDGPNGKVSIEIRNNGQTPGDVSVWTYHKNIDGEDVEKQHGLGIIDPATSIPAFINIDFATISKNRQVRVRIVYNDEFKRKWERDVTYFVGPEVSSSVETRMYVVGGKSSERNISGFAFVGR